MSIPELTEVLAIDVVPYEHSIWCTVGDSKPFANMIEMRSWSEDGEHIWFMLGTHNFYKAKPDETVKVVAGERGERLEPKSLFYERHPQFDNEKFMAARPNPATETPATKGGE